MIGRNKPKSTAKNLVQQDPLSAIPLKPDNVEFKPDSRGCLHLRMTPTLKPLKRKIAKWLGYDYTTRLELDEYGSTYYQLIDGQRPLSAIVDELAKKIGKERSEVAKMVVMFTKTLMTRNMIVLKITPPPGRGGRS